MIATLFDLILKFLRSSLFNFSIDTN